MMLPLGFAQPLVLLALLALPVLWWLLRLVPPQPPYTLVAHAAASRLGGACHHRRRGSPVESSCGHFRGPSAARAVD